MVFNFHGDNCILAITTLYSNTSDRESSMSGQLKRRVSNLQISQTYTKVTSKIKVCVVLDVAAIPNSRGDPLNLTNTS